MPNKKAPSRSASIYLRDWVYGGIDGAVTTFAVVAGVAGASLSTSIVLILGFANLVADGFSMAAGSYSSSRTEGEQYDRILAETHRRIHSDPESQKAVLGRALAAKGFGGRQLDEAVETITANDIDWANTLMIEVDGLAPILRRPMLAALNTYGSFLVFGIVPLLPYLFSLGFLASSIMTAIAFFAIGSLKSLWTGRTWWRSGLGTLAIGALAAAIAYLVGYGLQSLVGSAP